MAALDIGFPHLYNISTSLVIAKEIVSRSSLFGFRTVTVEPGFRWLVDGKSATFRAVPTTSLPSGWLKHF